MANDEGGKGCLLSYRTLSRIHFIANSRDHRYYEEYTSVPRNDFYEAMRTLTQVILDEGLDVSYSIPSDAPLRGHSPNLIGYSALHFAHMIPSWASSIEELLNWDKASSSRNIIQADINCSTPLHQIIERTAESGEILDSGWSYAWRLNIDSLLLQHLNHNVRSNPSNKWGISHFHIACITDCFQVVNFFLDSGVNVNATINKNSAFLPKHSALHVAVRFSALASVRILLTFGASLHKKDACGRTPLELAILLHRKVTQCCRWIQGGPKDIKEIIIILFQAHLERCPRHTLYRSHLACILGRGEATGNFLRSTVNAKHLKTLGYTAVHYAAQFDEEMVKYLLENNGNLLVPDTDGVTPLDICIMKYGAKSFELFSNSLRRLINFTDAKAWDFLSMLHSEVKVANYFESNMAEDINLWRVSKSSPTYQGFTMLHIAVISAQEGRISLKYDNRREADFLEFDETNRDNNNEPWLQTIASMIAHGADFTLQDANEMSPLHLAFHLGKSTVVNSMLKFGPSVVNPIDETGLSHFHIACLQGDFEAASSYLQNGIPTNDPIACDCRSIVKVNDEHIVYREGSTPVHIAVAQRRVELVELMVSHGADVFAKDADGLTPIHLAFVQMKEPPHEDTKKIIDLLFSSPDARYKNSIVASSGLSHFHAACVTSDYSIVEDLLANDPGCHELTQTHVDKKKECFNIDRRACDKFSYLSPLYVTVSLGNWTTSDVLLRHGADFGIHTILPNGMSCLHAALMHLPKRYHEVRSFVSKLSLNWIEMVPLDEYGLTPLHIAAALHRGYSIQTLKMSEDTVNSRISPKSFAWSGYTALHMALEYYILEESDNCDDTIRILLSYGIDVTIPNSKNETALHMAFKRGLTKVVSLILDHNSFTMSNLIDDFGLSHFHIVCSVNRPQLVTRFLESGVDVNETTEFFADIPITDGRDIVIAGGYTTLHIAVLFRVEEVVDVLLSHGADANSRDRKGWTPLHEACTNITNNSIIEKLLRIGHADPNVMNVTYQSVFHVLMKFGRIDIDAVRILLEYPTSVHSQYYGGDFFSPIEYAIQLADFETLKVIMGKGLHVDRRYNMVELNPLHLLVGDIRDTFMMRSYTQPKHLRYNRAEYAALIDLLIENGCDIDSQDADGRTALYYAVKEHNTEAVVALLLSGADINVTKSRYGQKSALARTSSIPRGDDMKTKEVLVKHVRNLESFKFYISEVVRHDYLWELRLFSEDDSCMGGMIHRQQCEIMKMKNVFVGKGWTLYNFLIRNENQTALIVNKESLREIMALEYICNEFPELCCILKLRYRKYLERRRLLDSSIEPLKASVGVRLPDLCWDAIMLYLTNEDLMRFRDSS